MRLRRRARRAVVFAALLVTTGVATTAIATSQVTASRTPAKSTLVVLGDSLTWGTNHFSKSQSRLTAAKHFETVIVDSRWGRRISGLSSTRYSGNVAFKQLVTDGVRPSAVIVALGTNDIALLGTRRDYAVLIRELMDTIGNVPVVWVNVHRIDSPMTTSRSRVFNATLERVLAEYPLATTFDWASIAKGNSRVMAFDKIHHSPTGYEIRTKTYLSIAADLAQQIVDSTTTTTTTVAPTTTVDITTTVAP
jgi:lysophospholipase L1-like esterase